MRLDEIAHIVEEWAPPWSAWERDTVGLQVGRTAQKIRKVLVTLDVTRAVVREAIKGRYDLILSHHPLLFRMPKTITDTSDVGNLILTLAEHRIAHYAAHTNLDAARGGVSFTLGALLGLSGMRFLAPLKETLAKIIVFVPESHADRVRAAMSKAGAGTIGAYSICSFQSEGIGTFRGSDAAKPFVGTAGVLESVDEIRLEMIAPRASVSAIVERARAIHPYEQMAYDVYDLANSNPNVGMGVVGDLQQPMDVETFLKHVKEKVGTPGLRVAGPMSRRISRVAACGGGGSELLGDALRSDADAFVTADISYHSFHAASDRILLIDAGHYETEHVILKPLAHVVRSAARKRGESLIVKTTIHITNPVRWV